MAVSRRGRRQGLTPLDRAIREVEKAFIPYYDNIENRRAFASQLSDLNRFMEMNPSYMAASFYYYREMGREGLNVPEMYFNDQAWSQVENVLIEKTKIKNPVKHKEQCLTYMVKIDTLQQELAARHMEQIRDLPEVQFREGQSVAVPSFG